MRCACAVVSNDDVDVAACACAVATVNEFCECIVVSISHCFLLTFLCVCHFDSVGLCRVRVCHFEF